MYLECRDFISASVHERICTTIVFSPSYLPKLMVYGEMGWGAAVPLFDRCWALGISQQRAGPRDSEGSQRENECCSMSIGINFCAQLDKSVGIVWHQGWGRFTFMMSLKWIHVKTEYSHIWIWHLTKLSWQILEPEGRLYNFLLIVLFQ